MYIYIYLAEGTRVPVRSSLLSCFLVLYMQLLLRLYLRFLEITFLESALRSTGDDP